MYTSNCDGAHNTILCAIPLSPAVSIGSFEPNVHVQDILFSFFIIFIIPFMPSKRVLAQGYILSTFSRDHLRTVEVARSPLERRREYTGGPLSC